MRSIIFLTFVLLIAVATFLSGKLYITTSGISDNDYLLANNSLIARFDDKPLEKAARPIGAVKLSNDWGSDSVLSADGKELIFYSSKSGEARSLALENFDGGLLASVLTAKLKPGLADLAWSGDRKEIVADNRGWITYFNLNNGTSRYLGDNIKNFAFKTWVSGGEEENFAYLVMPASGNGGVYVANLVKNTSRKVFNTRSADWQMDWASDTQLLLFKTDVAFLLDINGGGLEKTAIKNGGQDADVLKNIPAELVPADVSFSEPLNLWVFRDLNSGKFYGVYISP